MRSLANETPLAPPVTPCHEPPTARTSKPPVYIFAIRSAISLLSEPVFTKIDFESGAGIHSRASVMPSSATTSGIIPLNRWNAFSPASCTARTMAG